MGGQSPGEPKPDAALDAVGATPTERPADTAADAIVMGRDTSAQRQLRVVACVADLMDRSRFAQVSAQVTFVRSADELIAQTTRADMSANLIVVDLATPGVLEAIGALPPGTRSIGYASHVDREMIDAARVAGVTDVLTRSKFFSQLVTILQ